MNSSSSSAGLSLAAAVAAVLAMSYFFAAGFPDFFSSSLRELQSESLRASFGPFNSLVAVTVTSSGAAAGFAFFEVVCLPAGLVVWDLESSSSKGTIFAFLTDCVGLFLEACFSITAGKGAGAGYALTGVACMEFELLLIARGD